MRSSLVFARGARQRVCVRRYTDGEATYGRCRGCLAAPAVKDGFSGGINRLAPLILKQLAWIDDLASEGELSECIPRHQHVATPSLCSTQILVQAMNDGNEPLHKRSADDDFCMILGTSLARSLIIMPCTLSVSYTFGRDCRLARGSFLPLLLDALHTMTKLSRALPFERSSHRVFVLFM